MLYWVEIKVPVRITVPCLLVRFFKLIIRGRQIVRLIQCCPGENMLVLCLRCLGLRKNSCGFDDTIATAV